MSCLAIIIACCLSACGTLDSYGDRVERLNRSITDARNSLLLLNILRAGYGHPMSFTAITNITANQVAGASLDGPSGAWAGPPLILSAIASGRPGISGSIGGSIGVTPLESREFYQGLLQSLTLDTVQFLHAQGYPRQLLYHLLIENVRLRDGSGERLLWNDAAEPRHGEFSDFIQGLIAAGVTLEAGRRGGRLCFDRGLTTPPPGAGPICTTDDADGLRGLPGIEHAEFRLRSTQGVFLYLGRLATFEYGDRVRLTARRVGGTIVGSDNRLFPLVHETPAGGCVAEVRFQGRFHCVPAEGAEQGPRVLQLLTQLVGLSVSVRDLPALPTVRITN